MGTYATLSFLSVLAMLMGTLPRSHNKEGNMATITLKGNPFETVGELPSIGSSAPDATLTGLDLSETKLSSLKGKNLVLNIFPSIDTPVCSTSVRTFNQRASSLTETLVLCISADLPFAQKRFCGAEELDNVLPYSTFRSDEFGKAYGVTIASGPLAGLLSRAVVVVNAEGKVTYTQQVSEIAEEPDYEAALRAVSA